MLFSVVKVVLVYSVVAKDEKRLFDYVKQSGGYVHEDIGIETKNGLRGMYSKKEIKSGQLLARIPWNTTISGKSQCESVFKLYEEIEKGVNSTKWPYLENMASYIPGQPYGWNETAYQYLEEIPPYDYKRHTLWFRGDCRQHPVVYGRALELYIGRGVGDPDQGFAMCPIYDLFNHANGQAHNTRITFDYGDSLQMYTTAKIQAGDQLFNSYGAGTPDLFRDYSFVEPFPQQWDFPKVNIHFTLFSSHNISFTPDLPNQPRTRQEFLKRLADLFIHLRTVQVPSTVDTSPLKKTMHLFRSILPASTPEHITQLATSLPLEEQLNRARAYREALLHAIQTAANALPDDPVLLVKREEEESAEQIPPLDSSSSSSFQSHEL